MAGQLRGIAFQHGDWELACDNTRTCRAAGYQPRAEVDGDSADDKQEAGPRSPVSVQLTRKAGPDTPVMAELALGHEGEPDTTSTFPPARSLTMRIGMVRLGQVALVQGHWNAALTPVQTAALLAALRGHADIAWTDGERTWMLSSKGAAAVLLKMDEFQGRLGTPGALVRTGRRDERAVLPALPAPAVLAPVPASDELVEWPTASLAALRQVLISSVRDECPIFTDPQHAPDPIYLHRLSSTKLLASTRCRMAGAGTADAFWAIDATPPFTPQLVVTHGREYARGKIDASTWGSGYDCMDIDEWTWDGRRFVQSAKGTTGMCRHMEIGGAWSLPVLVTDVRHSPARPSCRLRRNCASD